MTNVMEPAILHSASALELLAHKQDPVAWAWLVEQHLPNIYRSVRRMVGAHAAEDVCQDTFILIRSYAKSFRGRGGNQENEATAWIMRIACTTAISFLRGRQMKARHELIYQLHEKDRLNMAERETHEDESVIQSELGQLPDRYRLPLMMRFYGGLSFEQIGRELRCTAVNARIRAHRGLGRLRKRLAGTVALLTLTSLSEAEITAGECMYSVPSALAQRIQSLRNSPRTSTSRPIRSYAISAVGVVATLSMCTWLLWDQDSRQTKNSADSMQVSERQNASVEESSLSNRTLDSANDRYGRLILCHSDLRLLLVADGTCHEIEPTTAIRSLMEQRPLMVRCRTRSSDLANICPVSLSETKDLLANHVMRESNIPTTTIGLCGDIAIPIDGKIEVTEGPVYATDQGAEHALLFVQLAIDEIPIQAGDIIDLCDKRTGERIASSQACAPQVSSMVTVAVDHASWNPDLPLQQSVFACRHRAADSASSIPTALQ
jgi:RNA polymerase sigma factor (sigma-70 family)